MAIVMAGGVYCPLSPRDPEQRLYALIEQTKSRCVLMHYLTKWKFNDRMNAVNIELVIINNTDIENDATMDQLSDILVTPKNMCCIIFTSGSTGISKVVRNHTYNSLKSYYFMMLVFRFKFDIAILQSVWHL